jgi:hypothetical protein
VIIDHDRVGTDAQQAQSMISLDVRFASDSDRNADIVEGPQRAKSGLMQRSKMKSLFDHRIGALFVPNLTYA